VATTAVRASEVVGRLLVAGVGAGQLRVDAAVQIGPQGPVGHDVGHGESDKSDRPDGQQQPEAKGH
jgi:hypothetical protein